MAGVLVLGGTVMTLVSVHLIALLQARGVALAAAVSYGALIGPAQVGARIVEMANKGRHHLLWTLTVAMAPVVVDRRRQGGSPVLPRWDVGLDVPTMGSRIWPSATKRRVRTMKVETRTTRRAMLAGLAAGLAMGRQPLAAGLPVVAVTKDPNCGCCEKWVAHLREAGFTVTVTEGP